MANDVQKWEQQLDKEWDKAKTDIGNAVMRAATILRDAKEKSMLGGEWVVGYKAFLVKKKLGESAVNRLIKIAEYPLFKETKYQALMPNSSWVAVEIAHIIPAEKARPAFESGEINPEMSMEEAKALREKLTVVRRGARPPGSGRKGGARKLTKQEQLRREREERQAAAACARAPSPDPAPAPAREVLVLPPASAPEPRRDSSEDMRQQRMDALEKDIAAHVAKSGNKVAILYELQGDVLKEMEIRNRIMDVLSNEFEITKSTTTILNIEDERWAD